jgi:hypothetical protein
MEFTWNKNVNVRVQAVLQQLYNYLCPFCKPVKKLNKTGYSSDTGSFNYINVSIFGDFAVLTL